MTRYAVDMGTLSWNFDYNYDYDLDLNLDLNLDLGYDGVVDRYKKSNL